MSRVWLLVLLLAAGPAFGAPAEQFSDPAGLVVHERHPAPPPGVGTLFPGRHTGNEVLVKFRPSAAASARAAAHAQVRGTVVRRFSILRDVELVRLPRGASLRTAIAAYSRSAHVHYVEPNFIVRAFTAPSDPLFTSLWGLRNTGQNGGVPGADIGATRAWDLGTGSASVVVAVIDTGIDYTHPDLVANVWSNPTECVPNGVDDDGNGYVDDCHGIDVVNNDSDPMDDHSHGTHVAGTIGATGNNALGVVGVNWRVSIMACKFLDANGTGTTAGAIGCLDYVAMMKDRGVNIVATNNSWGGGDFSRGLFDAIAAHQQRGILFVAAAGNFSSDNDVSLTYPASYDLPIVTAVAATSRVDYLAYFSNWGSRTVHLSAPGDEILSTVPGNTFATFSGTSMAAPHVTGVAALLKGRNPGLDWRAIRNLILAGGDPKASLGETISQRRLSAYGALTCAGSALLRPLKPNVNEVHVGAASGILLSALHINCAAPAGNVNVVVSPGGEVVTLRDDGTAPDQVAGDGNYSALWTPPAAGTYTLTFPSGDVVTVTADPDLKKGFPVQTWDGPGGYHSGQVLHALVGNIDDEPNLEILVTGLANGPLYAFRADGSPVPGWPVTELSGVHYPALGNLTPGAGYEVFTGTIGFPGQLAAISGSGALLPGWPRNSGNYVGSPGTLGDVTGDGVDKVFIEEEDWQFHAYRPDGTPLPGWPVQIILGGQQRQTPAIADLDGDGKPDIVVPSEFVSPGGIYLFAHRANGSMLNGFPISFNGFVDTYLAIGDVDGDGVPDIIVPAWVGDRPGVLVLGNDGSVKRSMQAPAATGHFYGTAPALADLDGDCIPEIVLQTEGYLTVWRGDGSLFPGFPIAVPGGMGNSSPVIGDVDGDGFPDIVITTGDLWTGEGHVWVFDRHGVLHPRFPKALTLGLGRVPAIADLDGDGRNEIIVVGSHWNGLPGWYDKVWVYDLGGPPSGPIQWGQFMGGPKHQGTYVCPTAAPGPPPAPTLTAISPSQVPAGGPGFELTLTGASFVARSLMQVNGSARVTSFKSPTALAAIITAADVASAGTLAITVFTPAPGGGTSSARTLSVANPMPSLAAVSPSSTMVGGGPLVLTLFGSGFVSSSSVLWGGAARPTTFISATQLQAAIPASDLGIAAFISLTVVNPAPGGGVSSARTFMVANPAPALFALEPTSATAGALGITLTVTGANFVPGSTISWNGASRPTTFVSSTVLRTVIAAGDAALVGVLPITVLTPSPGGGSSNILTFTVLDPVTSGFTDAPLAVGNVVRAVHVSELRAAIDNLRTRTGLVRFDWTDATLVPGSSVVRRAHVEELRTALIAVYEAVGRPAPSFSDSTIAGVTVIRASQLEELRSAARALD
ncbi:MAG: hypothetical protein DMD97_07020 [Candidatus Rokuibacteriota bacterium]|nr:MAG: hypothetical protein DMD97_07020 [Candidatus Rokubacteria bacterium]